MEPHHLPQPDLILAQDEPDSPLRCLHGFEGLNPEERSTHAEILFRAHSIWEGKGRPDNSQLADWLEAEAEVFGER